MSFGSAAGGAGGVTAAVPIVPDAAVPLSVRAGSEVAPVATWPR